MVSVDVKHHVYLLGVKHQVTYFRSDRWPTVWTRQMRAMIRVSPAFKWIQFCLIWLWPTSRGVRKGEGQGRRGKWGSLPGRSRRDSNDDHGNLFQEDRRRSTYLLGKSRQSLAGRRGQTPVARSWTDQDEAEYQLYNKLYNNMERSISFAVSSFCTF